MLRRLRSSPRRREARALRVATLAVLGLGLLGAKGPASGPLVPDHPLTRDLSDAGKLAVEQIAVQPESRWPAILGAASHEDVLVQLQPIWLDFELAIVPLVSEFSDDDRKALQDLLRHPGLVDALADATPGDEIALERIVAAYPEAIWPVALSAGRDHHSLAVALSEKLAVARDAFEALIAPLPPEHRESFRELVGDPELTMLMLDNLAAVQRLAGSYRVSPAGTASQLRDLGLAAEQEKERRRQAAEAAEARRQLEQARKEARREARRLYRRYHDRWSSSCWWGDPFYYRRWDHYRDRSNRCWYPWYRYRRRWW